MLTALTVWKMFELGGVHMSNVRIERYTLFARVVFTNRTCSGELVNFKNSFNLNPLFTY